ncbi:MAG TPA: IS1182 family transposase [Steroidobacteraceae bacterium]|jgi:transposase|nr:IS1182 family transposase [Steroidobacteraceae bacterium]
MMGRQTGVQSQLFYLFNLEERIPESHLLRRLNPVVLQVLADLREKLAPFYSEIGRPSIDPELMIRMLIVGYCYGIRFERRLCEEVEMHLAYRWFCRLDLDDRVPDHSTFSVNRHGRFRDSDILRHVFEAVVRACMDAGLIKGDGFAVDASVIEADASRYHGKAPNEIDWSLPERQTRAVAEFLTALDDEDPDADRKLPKAISPVDPCSAWTAKANKRVQFGYGLNYLIDIESAIIVDVEATPARTYDEVVATKVMIKRTDERMGLKPKRLAADTAYGTAKFLSWLIGTGITPHIPVWDKGRREDGTFSRSDFAFDKKRNVYVCPTGKLLTTTGRVHDGRTVLYLASTRDCGSCPIKPQCTPNMTFRKIPRDVHEDARDQARALMGSPGFVKSRDERKKVEMRFAHLKTHHRFERMRLRGLSGARDEFHLAAIVQNLKTLANRAWRPPSNLPAARVA